MSNQVMLFISDPIVESDVQETVLEVLPDADVHRVEDLTVACDMLAKHKGWAWAVLDVPLETLRAPELQAALKDNLALPVVLSEELDDPGMKDWIFLDPPFSSDMLGDALRRTAPYRSDR